MDRVRQTLGVVAAAGVAYLFGLSKTTSQPSQAPPMAPTTFASSEPTCGILPPLVVYTPSPSPSPVIPPIPAVVTATTITTAPTPAPSVLDQLGYELFIMLFALFVSFLEAMLPARLARGLSKTRSTRLYKYMTTATHFFIWQFDKELGAGGILLLACCLLELSLALLHATLVAGPAEHADESPRIARLFAQISDLGYALANRNKTLASRDEEISELKFQLRQARDGIQDARNATEEVKEREESILDTHAHEIQRLRDFGIYHDDMKANLKKMQLESKKMQLESKKMQRQIHNGKMTLQQHLKAYDDIDGAASERKSELVDYEERLQTLEGRVGDTSFKHKAIVEEIKDLDTKRDTVQAELRKLQDQIVTAKADVKSLATAKETAADVESEKPDLTQKITEPSADPEPRMHDVQDQIEKALTDMDREHRLHIVQIRYIAEVRRANAIAEKLQLHHTILDLESQLGNVEQQYDQVFESCQVGQATLDSTRQKVLSRGTELVCKHTELRSSVRQNWKLNAAVQGLQQQLADLTKERDVLEEARKGHKAECDELYGQMMDQANEIERGAREEFLDLVADEFEFPTEVRQRFIKTGRISKPLNGKDVLFSDFVKDEWLTGDRKLCQAWVNELAKLAAARTDLPNEDSDKKSDGLQDGAKAITSSAKPENNAEPASENKPEPYHEKHNEEREAVKEPAKKATSPDGSAREDALSSAAQTQKVKKTTTSIFSFGQSQSHSEPSVGLAPNNDAPVSSNDHGFNFTAADTNSISFPDEQPPAKVRRNAKDTFTAAVSSKLRGFKRDTVPADDASASFSEDVFNNIADDDTLQSRKFAKPKKGKGVASQASDKGRLPPTASEHADEDDVAPEEAEELQDKTAHTADMTDSKLRRMKKNDKLKKEAAARPEHFRDLPKPFPQPQGKSQEEKNKDWRLQRDVAKQTLKARLQTRTTGDA